MHVYPLVFFPFPCANLFLFSQLTCIWMLNILLFLSIGQIVKRITANLGRTAPFPLFLLSPRGLLSLLDVLQSLCVNTLAVVTDIFTSSLWSSFLLSILSPRHLAALQEW